MSVKIITDSCCDLPLTFVEAHSDKLEILGMPVEIDGTNYIDDLGKTLDHKTFYDFLRRGILPTTSQINVYRFEEAFKSNIENGREVLYIGFSSGLSGTFNSACVARKNLLEEYPDAKIELVDTLSASIGQGAIVVEAIKRLENNNKIDDIKAWIEENKLHVNHWFGVDDLNYLKNGGRISSASAIMGNMLNVKPTLIVDASGKLKPYGKVRGRKKSMSFLASKVTERIDTSNTTVLLGHGNCLDEAEQLRQLLISESPELDIIITELSMTIASHVGPNMLAVAFFGDKREE